VRASSSAGLAPTRNIDHQRSWGSDPFRPYDGGMTDGGSTHDLTSLLVVAEDIRDGRRAEPFTGDEIYRLCNELKRAIALLGADEGESVPAEDDF
jgi:hypothetical protein